MLTVKSLARVAPEVTLWVAVGCTSNKAHKQVVHPSFETQGGRDHNSNGGVPVALKKRLMSSKNLNKIIRDSFEHYNTF